jgi:hypothetical protein
LALDEDRDVGAIDFHARGIFAGHGGRLVRGLVEHGGETEGIAVRGRGQLDLLVIFVDGGQLHPAGEQDVSAVPGLTHLVDGVARAELANLNLRREDGEFLVIEKRKELDVA